MMKIRTIITQDAEVDDQNSLRHFLFYANEVELQGIVQTSSKFHWRGIPGAVKPEVKDNPHAFPDNARPGDQVHVIVKATEKGYFGLSRYAQIVLRVEM